MERIAKNNPSKRNNVQAQEARQSANDAILKNESINTVTTGVSDNVLNKKVGDVKLFGANNTLGYDPNAPFFVVCKPIKCFNL